MPTPLQQVPGGPRSFRSFSKHQVGILHSLLLHTVGTAAVLQKVQNVEDISLVVLASISRKPRGAIMSTSKSVSRFKVRTTLKFSYGCSGSKIRSPSCYGVLLLQKLSTLNTAKRKRPTSFFEKIQTPTTSVTAEFYLKLQSRPGSHPQTEFIMKMAELRARNLHRVS